MKKLPIGISTLSNIIDGDFVYVDKTAYLQQLAESGKYYFLSRPRRFGKSLLVDTLHQLFAGNEALFRGLYIHPHWDWSVQYPVISINFADGFLKSRAELDRRIRFILGLNQQRLGVTCASQDDPASCFAELIHATKAKYGQNVVILIDEYDKPMLDNITDQAVMDEMRDGLKNLYSVIKGQDAYLRFVLLTGVSKFSKVSIFSGLNSLQDITLNPAYSALCGYSQSELEHYFGEHLQGADMGDVQRWYNGYNWLGESVYNPFDILLFIANGKQFRNYWFETGTPGFLVDLLKTRYYHLPDFEGVEASEAQLGDFDMQHIQLETLLFQTGYLTIKRTDTLFDEPIFVLSYPNREVRSSFNQMVLERYLSDQLPERLPFLRALLKNDFATLQQRFTVLFDGIAHQNYTKNNIAHYEGYYAAVMYAFICALGIDTVVEDSHNKGRIDMTLRFKLPDGQRQVYIFEFKVLDGDQPDGSAMQQLKEKDYAAKYRDGQNRIFLIGLEFSKITRNIIGFEWEQA
jgi:hypothetical protein